MSSPSPSASPHTILSHLLSSPASDRPASSLADIRNAVDRIRRAPPPSKPPPPPPKPPTALVSPDHSRSNSASLSSSLLAAPILSRPVSSSVSVTSRPALPSHAPPAAPPKPKFFRALSTPSCHTPSSESLIPASAASPAVPDAPQLIDVPNAPPFSVSSAVPASSLPRPVFSPVVSPSSVPSSVPVSAPPAAVHLALSDELSRRLQQRNKQVTNTAPLHAVPAASDSAASKLSSSFSSSSFPVSSSTLVDSPPSVIPLTLPIPVRSSPLASSDISRSPAPPQRAPPRAPPRPPPVSVASRSDHSRANSAESNASQTSNSVTTLTKVESASVSLPPAAVSSSSLPSVPAFTSSPADQAIATASTRSSAPTPVSAAPIVSAPIPSVSAVPPVSSIQPPVISVSSVSSMTVRSRLTALINDPTVIAMLHGCWFTRYEESEIPSAAPLQSRVFAFAQLQSVGKSAFEGSVILDCRQPERPFDPKRVSADRGFSNDALIIDFSCIEDIFQGKRSPLLKRCNEVNPNQALSIVCAQEFEDQEEAGDSAGNPAIDEAPSLYIDLVSDTAKDATLWIEGLSLLLASSGKEILEVAPSISASRQKPEPQHSLSDLFSPPIDALKLPTSLATASDSDASPLSGRTEKSAAPPSVSSPISDLSADFVKSPVSVSSPLSPSQSRRGPNAHRRPPSYLSIDTTHLKPFDVSSSELRLDLSPIPKFINENFLQKRLSESFGLSPLNSPLHSPRQSTFCSTEPPSLSLSLSPVAAPTAPTSTLSSPRLSTVPTPLTAPFSPSQPGGSSISVSAQSHVRSSSLSQSSSIHSQSRSQNTSGFRPRQGSIALQNISIEQIERQSASQLIESKQSNTAKSSHMNYKKILTEGQVFRKWKHKRPQNRLIWLTPRLDHLLWGPSDKSEVKGFLVAREISQIQTIVDFTTNRIFLHTPSRILELEALDQKLANLWVNALEFLIALHRKDAERRAKLFVSPQNKSEFDQTQVKVIERLTHGDLFTCFPSGGAFKPKAGKQRIVQVDCSLQELHFRHLDNMKSKHVIPLNEVVQVEPIGDGGRFSILCKKFAIDCEALSMERRDAFIEAIRFFLTFKPLQFTPDTINASDIEQQRSASPDRSAALAVPAQPIRKRSSMSAALFSLFQRSSSTPLPAADDDSPPPSPSPSPRPARNSLTAIIKAATGRS